MQADIGLGVHSTSAMQWNLPSYNKDSKSKINIANDMGFSKVVV